jgi:hypothetical protein
VEIGGNGCAATLTGEIVSDTISCSGLRREFTHISKHIKIAAVIKKMEIFFIVRAG